MRLTHSIATALWLLCVSHVASAAAQDESLCFDELTECFRLEDDARAACFAKGARSAACRDTEQGQLASKRASYSSSSTSSPDGEVIAHPETTIEPSLIDRDCVDNFDSFWLGNLVNGPISADTMVNLLETLDGCARNASQELMRP
jgi:hypothetical protein